MPGIPVNVWYPWTPGIPFPHLDWNRMWPDTSTVDSKLEVPVSQMFRGDIIFELSTKKETYGKNDQVNMLHEAAGLHCC